MDLREYGMTARRPNHMVLYLITTRATLSFDLGGYDANPSKYGSSPNKMTGGETYGEDG
jgi:hypothetical protein